MLADGRSVVASEASLTHPAEVVRFATDGSGLTRLTRVNDELLAPFGLKAGESVRYTGAAGKSIQAWLVKPPDFDPSRQYPLLVLVHGGPQGAWTDGWTYRWNAELFASAGFVVFLPNPRGSVGWGQELTDDVNRDWGGRAYEDVMKGTDWAEALPYVAKGRTAAAGASYGGYLIDWIAGHTARFRALVTHDGVFDLVSMYGSTEELWFPEWELGGPYWKKPAALRALEPARVRRWLQDADARDPRRARLPRARRAGARDVHRAAPAGRARAPRRLPRREPLGSQAGQLGALVRGGPRLARALDEGLSAWVTAEKAR